MWEVTQGDQEGEWPKDVKIYYGKMYLGEKLCVPDHLMLKVVKIQHEACGHIGVDRLREECHRRYVIPDPTVFNQCCYRVKRACATCAQCEPPTRQRHGKIAKYPIPPKIWESVSIDVFSMPETYYANQKWNAMIVCVDRHSGWIIALPTTKEGLTAEKAAKMLLTKWLDMGGGIPSVITSDQGSQFIGAWFQTLCACLGIRQAFSQAYRAQANGRAERAGRQIIDWMEKMNVHEGINWVESLPKVLQQYHDAVGESGFSPYEIIFGRFRSLGGPPYQPPIEAEDAKSFIERMKTVDEKVAEILNTKHEKMVERVNRSRKPRPSFAIGEKVWIYKPTKIGGHRLEPRWWGPAIVEKRVGLASYEVTWENKVQAVHVDDMKNYYPEIEDDEEGEELCLEIELQDVEEILSDRMGKNGIQEFLVHWKGTSAENDTWEPTYHFTQCCAPWLEYCRMQGNRFYACELAKPNT